MLKPIEVGQQVIVEYLGLQKKHYRHAVVTKVGRKYFQVSSIGYHDTKFKIENLQEVTEYGPSYRIHLSQADLHERIVADVTRQTLVKTFSGVYGYSSRFTSSQLMAACSALGLAEEVNDELQPQIDKLMEKLGK